MKISCIYILSCLDPNVNTEESSANSGKKIRASVLPLGISYIASVLKQSGHDVNIFPFFETSDLNKFADEVKNSDFFCLSVTSYDCWNLAKKLISKLKYHFPEKKIIAGGIFVTLSPEEIIENKNIDAVCIGDGEKALLEYAEAVKQNIFNKKIDNLFIRQPDGTVLKCDKISFIENIDSLPFIDRHMWDRWIFDTVQHKVLAERGCPYRCVFCANNRLGQICSGNYLRYRNINSIISEFEYILKEYPQTESFMLYAENIASDNERFFKLCVALKEFNLKTGKNINYTIILNVTKNFVKNNKIFDAMKEANIKWVMFGFETASKEIRNKLNRPFYDNRDILKFCRQMQKRNIHTTVYAMYCYPYETAETYNHTVKWLKFFKPDAIGWFWMEPQKGTELYNRFFVRKEEKYNRNLLLKFTDKWRFITFKFRVYICYKTLIETLFLSLEQFGIGEQIFSLWRMTNISKRKKLEEYKNEAKKQFDLKNFEKAVKYLNKIESLGDSWIFADRAFANFKLGKKQEALKDINTALKLEKDNKNYHNLRNEIIKYK
jgi:radical SAM superfamily enzyme YgiQ (UPF0313 family)